MLKYYIFISGLVLFVISILVVGFMIGGSPLTQKLVLLDNQRISDFRQLETNIESYYSTHNMLPSTLSDITPKYGTNWPLKDPDNQKEYTYKLTSTDSYQLCTTFSTDTRSSPDSINSYYDITVNPKGLGHKQGYGCIDYLVPNYMKNNRNFTPTALPLPLPTITSCVYEESTGVLISENATAYKVKLDSSGEMTISKGGLGVVLRGNPKAGDKVKVLKTPSCQMEIDRL